MSEIKSSAKESLSYIFFRNPVLVLGLVIGQLAAGGTNLQNGVALSVTYLFIVVPVLVFASVFGKKLPAWLKTVVYALISAAMLVPSYFISGTFSATIFDSVGIYPALLAVSTVPIVYSAKLAEEQKPVCALTNALCLALGFSVVAIFLGAARELLGNGSLWGFEITKELFPAAKLSSWGFIFLGFMAAFINLVKDLTGKNNGEEEKQ